MKIEKLPTWSARTASMAYQEPGKLGEIDWNALIEGAIGGGTQIATTAINNKNNTGTNTGGSNQSPTILVQAPAATKAGIDGTTVIIGIGILSVAGIAYAIISSKKPAN